MKIKFIAYSLFILLAIASFSIFKFSIFECKEKITYRDSKFINDLGRLVVLSKYCGATTEPSTHVLFKKDKSVVDTVPLFIASGVHDIRVTWEKKDVLTLSYNINSKDIFVVLKNVRNITVIHNNKR